ncbi:MAG: response regulator [Verrucomicrobia bacterium]|nr:response regulator [Verrucomicrobiota bacterium]
MAKHSKRILVADDEESIRRLREYNLRKFGFEPVLVKNGSEAILAASDDLTCVLVDLKMPEVGGLAVLEHLKKAHPDVPVIIMSKEGEGSRASTRPNYGQSRGVAYTLCESFLQSYVFWLMVEQTIQTCLGDKQPND